MSGTLCNLYFIAVVLTHQHAVPFLFPFPTYAFLLPSGALVPKGLWVSDLTNADLESLTVVLGPQPNPTLVDFLGNYSLSYLPGDLRV